MTKSESPKPNLVFIMADDLSRRDVGCYGSENSITPTIDALAEEGMRFKSCYSAVAMCAPLRMQLYTGLHPVRSGAWPNHSKVYDDVKSIVHYLRPEGYRVGLSGKWHVRPVKNFPFDKVKPDLTKKAYLDYMTRSDSSFALFVCSHEPHTPWNRGDASKYNPDDLVLPPDIADTDSTRIALCRYYAEIEYLDNQVKEVLEALEESGKEDNTIVMFATEQGAALPGSKWTLYDIGIGAGLIVRWPGTIKPGSYSEAMVNYIDILPTFLDIIGAPIPDLDGHSFLPVLEGKTDKHDQYVFGIHSQKGAIGSPATGYPIRSVQDDRFALIKNLRYENQFSDAITTNDKERFWPSWVREAENDPDIEFLVNRYLHRPAIEFYDLQNDPYQLHNLADDPQYSDRIKKMDAELEAWMARQGDTGVEIEDLSPSRQ